MPNIGDMPTGEELAQSGAQRGSYGSHLTWEKDEAGCVSLVTKDNETIAHARIGQASPDLETIQSIAKSKLLVSYINAFIFHSNLKVEKNWRTKVYQTTLIDKTQPAKPLTTEHGESQIRRVIETPGKIAIVLISVDGDDQIQSLTRGLIEALEVLKAQA